MPLYEYTCGQCEHPFELLVLPGEREPAACPECGSVKVNRGFGTPAAPVMKAGTALPLGGGACQSSGPPCGPACSRF